MRAGDPGRKPRSVYLDHAAASPVRPEVAAAMAEVLLTPGNPASPHGPGRHARELLERSRRTIAERMGVAHDRVVFTSGGTEANGLALLGFPGAKLVGATEHASVLEVVPDARRIPVDGRGVMDLEALARLLAEERPALASVMLANNETGVVQPIAEVARLVHAAGGLLHCDAAQAFGKLPCSLAELGADLASLSAHKLGGPPGVGALVLRPGLEPAPTQRGGGQEGRRRAGTPNLPGIVGFAAAVELTTDWDKVASLRDGLEGAVRAWRPDVVIAGGEVPRLPNISCLITPRPLRRAAGDGARSRRGRGRRRRCLLVGANRAIARAGGDGSAARSLPGAPCG